jgi:hypothetical protein
MFFITAIYSLAWRFAFAAVISFAPGGRGEAHTGIVDGYGCHRGPDKVSYHCHQGQFVGRTFKSKDDFLRELRGGRSENLSPKRNPPRSVKRPEE